MTSCGNVSKAIVWLKKGAETDLQKAITPRDGFGMRLEVDEGEADGNGMLVSSK